MKTLFINLPSSYLCICIYGQYTCAVYHDITVYWYVDALVPELEKKRQSFNECLELPCTKKLEHAFPNSKMDFFQVELQTPLRNTCTAASLAVPTVSKII